jgi:putative membrane protein insertion efficiency factor
MERKGRGFRVLRIVALACAVSVAANAQAIALAAVHGYQRVLAPIAEPGGIRCRFTPSCSRYAESAIARDGIVRGGWKSLARIARCNPLTPFGTRDNP